MNAVAGRLSVRGQLTLWNIAVVALALGLFGVALRFGVDRLLLSTIDSKLMQTMDHEVRLPRRHGGRGPGDAPPGFLDRSDLGRDGSAVLDDRRPAGEGGQDGGFGQQPGGQDAGGPPQNGNGPQQGNPGRNQPDQQERPQPNDDSPNVPGMQLQGNADAPARPNGPPHRMEELPPVFLLSNGVGVHLAAPYSVSGFDQAEKTRSPVFTEATRSDGESLRVLSIQLPPNHGGPPFARDAVVGQVAAPDAFISEADRGVTETLLLLIPAAMILTGIGGTLLTNRALNPVNDMGRRLSHIQAQNLKERLPETGGGADEFSRLTGIVNAMLGRLEDAFERQRRFAADASHELRTPLATIRTTSSMALDRIKSGDAFAPEQYDSLLSRIDTAADRATRVTQDLLFLARVGTLPVRRERLSVAGVLEEARSSVILAAPTGKQLPPIVIDVSPDLRADSDRDHLLRLFINLLDNAARHTPSEGQVCVRARADATGGVTVSVIDTGEGIAPEHLARIREPFYRPDSARTRNRGGAGLGLAIAQGIVDALGGAMRIESAVGSGTTVTVDLAPAQS